MMFTCSKVTVVGKMKQQKVNCSHFMSFCSIDFIFIGEIGNYLKFLWVHRNFEFRPTNQIFRENTKICFFKNGHFSLDDVKNERYVKTTLCIVYIMDSSSNNPGHILTIFIIEELYGTIGEENRP